MGVEDEFCSVSWESLLQTHARLGPTVFDGNGPHLLENVRVDASTPLHKGLIFGYTELAGFLLEWRDFSSTEHGAFIKFVHSISYAYEKGPPVKSDLVVSSTAEACVFAPPRVRHIWDEALSLVSSENLRPCVDAVAGLGLSLIWVIKPYPEFGVRFEEIKRVWHDAVQRENAIVIIRF
jgi:hypothetical protein